jgi:hypothetical protein
MPGYFAGFRMLATQHPVFLMKGRRETVLPFLFATTEQDI